MLASDGKLCCDAAALTFQTNQTPPIWSNVLNSPLFNHREQGTRGKVILGAFYNLGGIPIPSVLVFPARQQLPLHADTDFPSPLSLSSLSAPSQQYYFPCWSLSLLAMENLFSPYLKGSLSPDLTIRKRAGNRVVFLLIYDEPETLTCWWRAGKVWCSVNLLVAILSD